MKTFYRVIAVALCLSAISSAQTNFIKNGGFESWTNNVPDNWVTDASASTKTTTAHSGSYALKLNTYLYFGIAAYPGAITQYIPVTGATFTLRGWYQLHSDSGDAMSVTMLASKAGVDVGAGDKRFTTSTTAYTAFTVGMVMDPNTTADTCTLLISMEDNGSGTAHVGSYAMFDDLVLDNTTGVASDDFARPSSYQLAQNYPNPFNPSTEIEFTIAQQQHVSLRVYNVMGQEIETLVDGQLPQGRYKKVFDASRLSSGTNFYKLEAGSFAQVKRLMLVK